MMVGNVLVIPWLSFSATAKPVSNRPAARTVNHAIASPLRCGALVISR